MKIYTAQFYIDPEASFPFSYHCQRFLSEVFTGLAKPTGRFEARYGDDFEVMIRVSAKRGIADNELLGPTVFRKDREVEYSLFLPYDLIMKSADWREQALKYWIAGACKALRALNIGFDTESIEKNQAEWIERICSDPKMLG